MFKRMIKSIFVKMGYELRPLNILHAGNAVIYNRAEFADRFYADPKSVAIYMDQQVPIHLENLRRLLAERAIVTGPGTRILDAGCGTGQCLKMLYDEYGCRQLSGIEHSEQALGIARAVCPEAHLAVMDLLTGRSADRFDLIICMQVLEHISEAEKALRNMAGMLAAGGILLLTVPDGRIDDFAGHVHFWGPDSWPLFLGRELPGYDIVTGRLQDEVSLYAIVSLRPAVAS